MGPGFFFTPWSSDPNVAVNSVGKMPPTSGNLHQVRNIETGEICKARVAKFCSSFWFADTISWKFLRPRLKPTKRVRLKY